MKTYLSMEWVDIERLCEDIANALPEDCWKPEIIVGIQEDGLIPARILSTMLDCPMVALDARVNENGVCVESNLWLAEDALGVGENGRDRKNTLIVDGYGSTISLYNNIVSDWMAGCHPNSKDEWNAIWGTNVRFACLAVKYNNIKYYEYAGMIVEDNSVEIEFPWNRYPRYHRST